MKWLLLLLALYLPAWADSVPFVYQNQGFSTVSLAGDPLVNPTLRFYDGSPRLEFGAVVAPASSTNITFTLSLDGQTVANSFSVSCPLGCIVIDGFPVANIYRDTPGVFAMTIDGHSAAYNFLEISVVPEPGTIIMAGTGLLLIGWRRLICARIS